MRRLQTRSKRVCRKGENFETEEGREVFGWWVGVQKLYQRDREFRTDTDTGRWTTTGNS